MQVFRHTSEIPITAQGAVVALGNFDGVHEGHRGVISMAQAIAKSLSVPCGVMTFEPHPRSVFRPDDPPFRLAPFRVKTRLLEAFGLDMLVVLHFDDHLRNKPAEDFVREDLVQGLKVRHAVFGHDFAFGHRRAGNAALLEALGAKFGFGVTAVPPITAPNGTIYSSTAIRKALVDGDMAAAAALLGHWFEIEGRVVGGERLGRTIGFPTANILLGDYQRPALGVYAVQAGIDEGTHTVWIDGVANLGARPTVNGTQPRLEVNLFDFNRDIYDRHLRVRLIEFLRPEQRFNGLEALKEQIVKDATAARQRLSRGLAIPK